MKMEMDITAMKIKFENAIISIINYKKRNDNTAYINTIEYEQKILAIKNTKYKKKNVQDYRLVRS